MTLYGTGRALLKRKPRHLDLTATTTGAAETVSIARLTTNVTGYIDWGDGSRSMMTANSEDALEHEYAVAGTYNIRVHRAEHITQIWLDNAKLGGLDTAQLRWSRITYFWVTLATGCTIRSADMVDWRPEYWRLNAMPAGTYSIASADMVAWRPSTWHLNSMPAAGSSYTFAASCMRAWTAVQDMRADGLALSGVVVDTILTDIYAGKATYTYAAPSLYIGGTNAAPTGTYQDRCPPTSGLETVYALANGNCEAAGPEWSITYTGGTAP